MTTRIKRVFVATIVLNLLLPLFIQILPAAAQLQRGPRSPYLDMIFYTCPSACYAALKNGDIDIMAWPVDKYMREEIVNNPQMRLLLAPYTSSYEMRGYNFNTNTTISTYTHIVDSPLSNESFRKAVAYLIDKNYIISTIFEGCAERIDVPFPESQRDWWNTTVIYPNYPYEFSLTEAAILLNSSGFIDRDGDGTRNYPLNWSGRPNGPNLDPIVLYVENNDGWKTAMGWYLRGALLLAGIPVAYCEVPPLIFYDRVMVARDYHICVGSQVAYRFPIWWTMLATMVFTVTFFGQQYTHAELWKYLPQIRDNMFRTGLAPLLLKTMRGASWEESLLNVKKAQGIYVERAYEIPVCSLRTYIAYRDRLAGVVDETGYGVDNPYTCLNMYRTDNPNEVIRIGMISEPAHLNIVYSTRQPDYECLDKIYAGLIHHNPYDTTSDIPWIAQDWETGTWLDPISEIENTAVTYYFRKDACWTKPVTGDEDGLFNASDYEFTCHYFYAQPPYSEGLDFGCPHYDRFKYVDHVEIIDDFTVKVCMNETSMWAYQWSTYPLLPKHKWLREPLAYNRSIPLAESMDLPGTLSLGEYVVSGRDDTKVKALLANGTEVWLKYGEHFMWRNGEIYINTDSVNGVKILLVTWACYWVTGDARGYCPGNLPFEDILEGCGTHYVLNIDESSYVLLNANRHFFMETPLLGEVDWRWNWVGGSKPRDGFYKVDVIDVVKCTSAYCVRGDGYPNPLWLPGADLDRTDVGHIGILDMAQITSNYAQTFGRPP